MGCEAIAWLKAAVSTPPFDAPLHLIHGGLESRHVLVDPSTGFLHGVIDWLTRRIAGIDRAEEQDRQMAALEAQREATRTALGVTEPVAVPPAVAPPVVAPVVSDPTWAVPSGDVVPPPQQGDPIYPPNP